MLLIENTLTKITDIEQFSSNDDYEDIQNSDENSDNDILNDNKDDVYVEQARLFDKIDELE